MIAFRRAHPVLRARDHVRNVDYVGSGIADITWHGTQAWNADWSNNSRVVAWMLDGKHAKCGTVQDNTIYVAMSSHWGGLWFELPKPPAGTSWHVFANTGMPLPQDICEPGREPRLDNQDRFMLGPRSFVVLVAK
jgi:glycogen operon protein